MMTLGRAKTFAATVCAALFCTAPHAALASGTIPFVSAWADSPDGNIITLVWDAPGVRHVRVLASRDGQRFADKPRFEGGGAGHVTLTLPPEARWYFELVPDHGNPLVIADRSLHLSSVANFRDVGGYRTADGHWVKMGVAYRTNALNAMTAQDMTRVETLGIKIVCDLRMDSERVRSPDPEIATAKEISDNVLADEQAKFQAVANSGTAAKAAAADATERMKHAYRDFVDLGSARAAYHDLFERLSDPANLPTVFHCTAGKDRTGWAQAVLLTILGVPHDIIVKDYELTDRYLAPQASSVTRTFAPGISAVATQKMMAADPAYLDAAFAEVAARYGSFDNYLHRGLSLNDKTLAAIRQNFLIK